MILFFLHDVSFLSHFFYSTLYVHTVWGCGNKRSSSTQLLFFFVKKTYLLVRVYFLFRYHQLKIEAFTKHNIEFRPDRKPYQTINNNRLPSAFSSVS